MKSQHIINCLPYREPFLFVDDLTKISNQGITGHYTYKETAFFYKGHFKDRPITPGVILIETMAQIGLVCLGIYIIKDIILDLKSPQIALTSSDINFYLPVFPGEKVTVVSQREVFRFNKLKCLVKLYNVRNELVCRGKISGMIK